MLSSQQTHTPLQCVRLSQYKTVYPLHELKARETEEERKKGKRNIRKIGIERKGYRKRIHVVRAIKRNRSIVVC